MKVCDKRDVITLACKELLLPPTCRGVVLRGGDNNACKKCRHLLLPQTCRGRGVITMPAKESGIFCCRAFSGVWCCGV